jgi:hypothetical protein
VFQVEIIFEQSSGHFQEAGSRKFLLFGMKPSGMVQSCRPGLPGFDLTALELWFLGALPNGSFSGQFFAHSNQEHSQSQGQLVPCGRLPSMATIALCISFPVYDPGVFFQFSVRTKDKRI